MRTCDDGPVPPTPPSSVRTTDETFTRDTLTLSLYGTFMTWGWFLYSFNPSVTLVAAELGISRAVAGLHGTSVAVGSVLAGLIVARLVVRFGRRNALVGALALVVVGVAVLTLGPGIASTLSGVFVIAVGCNIAVASSQVALSLHHGRASSAAITEANGVGSGVGLVGPLAVGLTVGIGWGWRPAVAVVALLAVFTAWRVSRRQDLDVTAPALPARTDGEPASIPTASPGAKRAMWWFLAAVIAALSLENATTYWATDLIISRTGADDGIAAAATAGLVAGMTLIRFVVGPLTARIAPVHLLAGSFLFAIIGWFVLWTTTSTTVALVGLFLAGVGYGAQYPLSIALLLRVAGGAVDRAQSRATYAGGIAMGVAPFALGALADASGAHTAFLVVPVLALAGAAAAFAGGRSAARGAAA